MALPTGLAKVTPRDLPQEHDYHWRRPSPGTAPSVIEHYRDLPITGGGIVEEVGQVKAALSQLMLGQFMMVGSLVDAMLADDRVSGVLSTRLDALASLPLEVTPGGPPESAPHKQVADRLFGEWHDWVDDAEAKLILMWGQMVGLGIGEIIWDTTSEPGYFKPRVKAWDPRYAFWRWDTRSFWMVTYDGVVELTPGDGHWILYCPHGYCRGWAQGLVRPLARPFLWRQWATRDWARFSEVHGMPIKKAFVPAEATDEEKQAFESDLQYMGAEGLVRLARSVDGNSGFDLELMEAASTSYECFKAETELANEAIAVTVLGQNLTTSAKAGGSYALGDVHDQIRKDRLEFDAKSLGDCMTDQLVVPWASYNYGAPLAPHMRWSTKAIDDRAQTATTWNNLGLALTALTTVGVQVDFAKVAEAFRLPIAPGGPAWVKPAVPPPAAGGGAFGKGAKPQEKP